MYWIHLPESWKAGSDSSGRWLFPASGVYEQQPRLSGNCAAGDKGLSRNHCLLGHVGSVPPSARGFVDCECQKCVFSRAHGCNSKAGSVCINSRSASADPLRICYQRPGQRHRRAVTAGAPEWSMRQPSAAVNLAAAAAGLANILKDVVSLEEQPWMSRRIYPYL